MSVRDKVEKFCRAGQAADNSIQVIWHTRIACWMIKATNTHSEYVILIAFPRRQSLRERAPVIHYTYVASLVLSSKSNSVEDEYGTLL